MADNPWPDNFWQNPIETDQLHETAVNLFGYDQHQDRNVTIIRFVSAIISLLSSCTLIWMLRKSNARFSTTNNRILLGMSLADILASLSMANLNVTTPVDVDYVVWNAMGNQASCTAQNFCWWVGVMGALLYAASLNLYYLATVKHNMTEEQIRKRIEPFLHGVPILFTAIAGINSVVRGDFNEIGGICTGTISRPLHCIGYEDGEVREGFTIPCGPCADGTPVFAFVVIFIIGSLVAPLIIVISLGLIYRSARQLEKKMARYGAGAIGQGEQQPRDVTNNEGDHSVPMAERLRNWLTTSAFCCAKSAPTQRDSNSRIVLARAVAYTISYFLSWTWQIWGAILFLLEVPGHIAQMYLFSILTPLQGFFNFLIYVYPKVKRAKSRDDNTTWIQAFVSSIAH